MAHMKQLVLQNQSKVKQNFNFTTVLKKINCFNKKLIVKIFFAYYSCETILIILRKTVKIFSVHCYCKTTVIILKRIVKVFFCHVHSWPLWKTFFSPKFVTWVSNIRLSTFMFFSSWHLWPSCLITTLPLMMDVLPKLTNKNSPNFTPGIQSHLLCF